jgi:MscS family membrane protein
MRKFIFLFLFATVFSFAQTKFQPDLSSPNSALYTHMYFLQQDSYEPEKASLIIAKKNKADAIELAIKLKKIYDGKGIMLQFSKIPTDPNFRDTIRDPLNGFVRIVQKYYPNQKELPSVYLIKSGNKWVYSDETTENVDKLYSSIFKYDFTYLERKFPEIFSRSYKGVALWKPIVLLFVIGICILIFYLLRSLMSLIFKLLNKYVFKSTASPDLIDNLISIRRPLIFIIIIEYLKRILPSLQLLRINNTLFLLLNIAETVFWVFFSINLLKFVVWYYSRNNVIVDNRLQEQLSPIVIKVLNSFIILLGFLHLLTLFGVDPTTVLAGASIGGIAVAFAAQDSVKNLIGTFVIFLDKPFHIGDWVEIGSVIGTVEKVGLRSTVIRAADTSVFQIPNSKVAEVEINNKGLRIFRRYQTELGIRYDTPPELIQGFVNGVREIVKAHPDTRDESYNVEFTGFADSSLLILVNVYFKQLDWGEEQSSKHRLHMAIVRLAKALGVEFAFPSSTLIIEQFPEKKGVDLKYNTNKKVIDKAIQDSLKDFENFMNDQDKNIHVDSDH